MKPYTYKFPCTKSLPIWGDLEGYCGKERDEETGLYYYGMRYYAAWLCRFVSVDPLQFEYPELTPYQYASNNSITMIDLEGLEGVKPEEVAPHYSEADTTLLDYPLLDTATSSLVVEGVGGQNKTLEILSKAFGEQGNQFSFNYENQLIYKGNPNSFSKAERKVFDGLERIMTSSEITKIIFEKNLLTEKHGGEAVVTIADNPNLKENIIYIDPIDTFARQSGIEKRSVYASKIAGIPTEDQNLAKTDLYGNTEVVGYNEYPLFTNDSIAARFFHGLGHVLYPLNNEQKNVIRYDNNARNIFKAMNNGKYIKAAEVKREVDDAHKNKK